MIDGILFTQSSDSCMTDGILFTQSSDSCMIGGTLFYASEFGFLHDWWYTILRIVGIPA